MSGFNDIGSLMKLKAARKEYARRKAKERYESIRADETYSSDLRQQWVKNATKYRERHPDKHQARVEARLALMGGRITKPNNCQICGIATSELEMHHADYSRPTDVTFLCVECHRVADAQRRSREHQAAA